MPKSFKEGDTFHVRKWGRDFIFQFLVIKNRNVGDTCDAVCVMQHGRVRRGDKCFVEYNEMTRDVAVGLDDLEVVKVDGQPYMLVLASVHAYPDPEDTHKDTMRFIPMEKYIAVADIPDAQGIYPDGTFLSPSSKDSGCGKKGISHRMKRVNCMDTQCINDGCDGRI